MNVIVTGGNGFIGSTLVDKLIDHGHKVKVIDNRCTDSKPFYNPSADYHKIDVCNYDDILPLFSGVNVVFHLAAQTRIGTSLSDPRYSANVNVIGTCNVLEAARQSKVDKVIYSSTSACYGPKSKPPFTEDMARDVLNPYAVTKCAGEDLCVMYNDVYGLPTVAFRYFNVFGERMPANGIYAPVVGVFLRQLASGQPLTVVSDGLQRRDFIHVSDVVNANILAASSNNKKINGQVFNVGTGSNWSVLEIANMISDNVAFIPPRLGEARDTLADISKIKKYLGWSPLIEFKAWLLKTLEKAKLWN